jgi:hypothetical protein
MLGSTPADTEVWTAARDSRTAVLARRLMHEDAAILNEDAVRPWAAVAAPLPPPPDTPLQAAERVVREATLAALRIRQRGSRRAPTVREAEAAAAAAAAAMVPPPRAGPPRPSRRVSAARDTVLGLSPLALWGARAPVCHHRHPARRRASAAAAVPPLHLTGAAGGPGGAARAGGAAPPPGRGADGATFRVVVASAERNAVLFGVYGGAATARAASGSGSGGGGGGGALAPTAAATTAERSSSLGKPRRPQSAPAARSAARSPLS